MKIKIVMTPHPLSTSPKGRAPHAPTGIFCIAQQDVDNDMTYTERFRREFLSIWGLIHKLIIHFALLNHA